MEQITNDDVKDFIKYLVEFGGICKLEDDMTVTSVKDGSPVMYPEGDQSKPVQILCNGMVKNDACVILNPFKQVEGANLPLTQFYSERLLMLSALVKLIIVKIVEVGVSKETTDYDNLDLLASISEQCDKQMIDEMKKLNSMDLLRIFYNKKTKTAEAQTLVFTDTLEENFKHFRKKTWVVLKKLFREIFKLENDDMSKYTYKATVLSIPTIDAQLHVMCMLTEVIAPLAKSLLDKDLQPEKFKKHLKELATYAKAYAWFTSKVTDSNSTVVTNTPKQWNNTPVMPTTSDSNRIKINVDANDTGLVASTAGTPVVSSNYIPIANPGFGGSNVVTPGYTPIVMPQPTGYAPIQFNGQMGFNQGMMMPGPQVSTSPAVPAYQTTDSNGRILINC